MSRGTRSAGQRRRGSPSDRPWLETGRASTQTPRWGTSSSSGLSRWPEPRRARSPTDPARLAPHREDGCVTPPEVRERAFVWALGAALLADVIRFPTGLGGTRIRTFLLVLAAISLRRVEALALRWSDVDLDAGQARAARSLVRVGPISACNRKDRPRSPAGALSPAVVTELWAHRVLRPAAPRGGTGVGGDWLSTTEIGTPDGLRERPAGEPGDRGPSRGSRRAAHPAAHGGAAQAGSGREPAARGRRPRATCTRTSSTSSGGAVPGGWSGHNSKRRIPAPTHRVWRRVGAGASGVDFGRPGEDSSRHEVDPQPRPGEGSTCGG